MLSILVCHSFFLRLDQKQLERSKPYPPLATLQAASLLRREGHEVSLFDAMIASGVEDYFRVLQAVRPQVVLIYEDTFNFLSKMCLGAMRHAACEMITAAKCAGARVIVAGPDATDAPTPYLKSGADLALSGEGFAALLALLPRLDLRPDIPSIELAAGIPGTACLIDDQVIASRGPGGLPVSRHDGAAAWDLADIDAYRAIWRKAHGYFSLNVAASRGCSFRCAWCAKPTWGNEYLQRTPVEVAAEVAYLKQQFSPDHVWFADDIFGFRVGWVEDFARAIRSAGAMVPFTIQTRADLISERMARALREAGCREAWIGAESGSQRVLDAMNKGTTVEEILLARARLKAAGIRVGFFIQLGYMDEQAADIEATRNLILAARPDEIGVSVSYPLPGTKFHEIVQAQLGSKTRWQESSDLAMMFHGTYTSDFYRSIRNLLHEQISTQSGYPVDGASPRSLEQRWRELLDQETQYRSYDREAVTH